jgi:hypothetical protein
MDAARPRRARELRRLKQTGWWKMPTKDAIRLRREHMFNASTINGDCLDGEWLSTVLSHRNKIAKRANVRKLRNAVVKA